MKRTIIAALLALAALAGQGQTTGKTAGKHKETVWEHVVTGYVPAPMIEVTRVAMYGDHTDLSLSITSMKGRRIGFPSGIVLQADGKAYAMKGITVLKPDEPYMVTEDSLTLVMTFEAIPAGTRAIDYVSPDGLQMLGIRNGEAMPEGITHTYWRSEATGDWLIGFAEKHVIYKNGVWDIAGRSEDKDSYTLTLADGTTVRVGKMKRGRRTIAIGTDRPVVCTPVVGSTLPDYPAKDGRTGFADNGYRTGDSVTIAGWLKDMPERAWGKGREFAASYSNLLTGETEDAYAPMDSLGRFLLRMPLVNSSQVFLDWERTNVSTVLEPGKTYFLLRDFKTGQTLFMGDDVRTQNELLAYPYSWQTADIDRSGQTKMDAAKFRAEADSIRQMQTEELQRLSADHPTLSQRYLDYVSGYYRTAQGKSMMQLRFQTDFQLPADYVDFVGRECWQQSARPYSIYRDFAWMMTDYLDHLVGEKQKSESGVERTRDAILRLADAGSIVLTDEERTIVADRYVAEVSRLQSEVEREKDATRRQEMIDAFNDGRTIKVITSLFDRYGSVLTEAIMNEQNALTLHHGLAVLDSVNADPQLRDIYLARRLCRQIDETRRPLAPALMAFMEKEVTLPAALDIVRNKQEKYLAIERGDLTKNAQSLKSADDVAGMSDGEEILRRLTEPYRGRLVLLDVWGTWCGPCKEAFARSKAERERLKDYGLVYLYLANRSSDTAWRNVIKEYDLTGDDIVHYNLPAAQQRAVERFLSVTAFPAYRLIDREGNVLDVNADPRDPDALARLLDRLK